MKHLIKVLHDSNSDRGFDLRRQGEDDIGYAPYGLFIYSDGVTASQTRSHVRGHGA